MLPKPHFAFLHSLYNYPRLAVWTACWIVRRSEVLSVELTGKEHKDELRAAMNAAIASGRIHSWGSIPL